MIYFILTACITTDDHFRENEYLTAYSMLETSIHMNGIRDSKIILVENNGQRSTYLDDIGEVFYTTNNTLPTTNKGHKELQDVLDCIRAYNIKDDDFIVKMTGRYFIQPASPFMQILNDVHTQPIECILRYGNYFVSSEKCGDCVTGLIGMRCKYVKQIEIPAPNECVEWKWAAVTYLMDDARVINLPVLGLRIHADSATYHWV